MVVVLRRPVRSRDGMHPDTVSLSGNGRLGFEMLRGDEGKLKFHNMVIKMYL